MGKQEDVINMMNCSVDNNSFSIDANDAYQTYSTGDFTDSTGGSTIGAVFEDWDTSDGTSCWQWWRDYYYPYVVTPSYPVYIKEKSYDKGEKAYEIIKVLRDKKLIRVEKIKDFVKLMDELIKLL